MLQPVFEGVAAMHEVGLVHRGICPANIRVLDNGRARLTGYATVGLRTAGSGLHEQLYEGFSAPEQYSTAEFEGRYTDEYSLAAVFYRMVCGLSPVPAAQRLVSDSKRIQTVPQLFKALSSQEYTQELARTMKPETAPAAKDPGDDTHLLSLRNLLAAILILLAVLTLLAVWGFVSTHLPEQGASSVTTPESVPEEPSITEPANLVPDFVGLDYDAQVRNNRSYVGDYLFYVTLEYSDTVAEGKIIRQEPAAGELLEEGGTISLVVSKGPEMIEMPNVIGFTQEGAVKELESRGLVPSCFMVVNDGSYASGCVVSCSAEAGTSVEAGSVIVVYIAADPSVENVPATPEQPAASDNTATADGSGEAPAGSVEYDTD